MVSELVAKAGVKVVLTGEGSDEYFLGYPYMVTRPYIRACQRVARLFQRLVHRLPAVGNLLWPDREADPANQLSNLMSRYVLQEIRSETNQRLSFIRNFNERDSRIMCIDGVAENLRTLLHRNDRLAMAWGVESRFPFLGHALASTAVNLPRRFKVHKTLHSPCWHHLLLCDKWIIRKIAEHYLPRELAYRRKYGFRCRFYNRMTVDKKLFYNGFLSQYYGLSKKAYDYLFETTPKKFLARLLCTEIWGQLFPLGLKVGQVSENLRRYVTLNQ
jgi:asparagine synthase (glutamine-hydrolysing)